MDYATWIAMKVFFEVLLERSVGGVDTRDDVIAGWIMSAVLIAVGLIWCIISEATREGPEPPQQIHPADCACEWCDHDPVFG